MAYDSALAERIRQAFADRPDRVAEADIVEKKMFGGIAFMLRDHMCCGVVGSDLMLRVGPGAYEDALARPHVRPMDFTGRPLRGMIYVGAAGVKSAASLRRWLDRGLDFVDALPPKGEKRAAKASREAPRKKAPAKGTRRKAR